jgi:hypothetical protein
MNHESLPGRVAAMAVRLRRCWQMDARLLLRAFGWRLTLPILKHVVPLGTLARFICARRATRSPAGLDAVLFLLRHGGRLAISANCLERSLLLYRFLTEAGASPQLVLGATADAPGIAGHAWIEVDGEPLADATTSRYQRVVVFSAGERAEPARERTEGVNTEARSNGARASGAT